MRQSWKTVLSTVRSVKSEAGTSPSGWSAAAKRSLIRISDDGVGMDEASLARMNERLEKSGRAFASQNTETKGGIALVNVNNRIHLLFGEEYGLHVFSMPGIGTDVEISLPQLQVTGISKIKRH